MKKQKSIIKKKLNKTIRGVIRENAKKDGFYDGRFKTREVTDKKKSEDKMACRKFRQSPNSSES